MVRQTLIHARSAVRVIVVLVILLGANAPALGGQVDHPGATPSPGGPASTMPATAGEATAPQAIGETSRVQMVLLPWSDPSIRILPPEQFLNMRAAALPGASFQITFIADGQPDPLNPARTCSSWSDSAKAAFNYAASIWASVIYSPVPIRIRACWTNMGSTSILGMSASNLLGLTSGGVSTLYNYALGDKLAGYDIDSASSDSDISYNSNFSWYFGMDGNPASSQVDFVSVVLHEMGHSLNFTGSMSYGAMQCRGDKYGCWGYGSGYPDTYDRFVENGNGEHLIDTTKFPNYSAALGLQLTGGNLFFAGHNASLANGNTGVKIYAPSTWVEGSSYSHLDYSTFRSTANRLMVYAIPSGSSIHDPGAVTMGMLKDLGWAPTVKINDVSVTEGNSGTVNANFAVSLSHAAPWPISINWATAAGTATAGVDYVSASGTATIAAGATSQTITVQVIGDTAFEPDETLYVNLTDAAGAYAFADNQGAGTIRNDDSQLAPTVSASLNGSTLSLTWSFVSASITYQVYRSTEPYFVLDTTQPLPADNYCAGSAGCKYQASVTPTDPNYFYVVRGTSSNQSGDSGRLGSFKYNLVAP
ncbi:MAG: Calx-beta domain-containing protein [Nitrososphaerales archaeon]